MSPKLLLLLGMGLLASVSLEQANAGLLDAFTSGLAKVIGGFVGPSIPQSSLDEACREAMQSKRHRKKRVSDPDAYSGNIIGGGLAELGQKLLGDAAVREGCRQAGASDVPYEDEPEPEAENEVENVEGPTQYVPVPTPVYTQ